MLLLKYLIVLLIFAEQHDQPDEQPLRVGDVSSLEKVEDFHSFVGQIHQLLVDLHDLLFIYSFIV